MMMIVFYAIVAILHAFIVWLERLNVGVAVTEISIRDPEIS